MKNCPDCAVKPGEMHIPGCDVERCSVCNNQHLSCAHLFHDPSQTKWEGEWPGVLECEKMGWYSYFSPGKGWVQCDASHPEATADLNRYAVHAIKPAPNAPSWYDYEETLDLLSIAVKDLEVTNPLLQEIVSGDRISPEAVGILDSIQNRIQEKYPFMYDDNGDVDKLHQSKIDFVQYLLKIELVAIRAEQPQI